MLSMSGCTFGLEQDFELETMSAVSTGDTDVLFELTNHGGNAAEPLAVYRVEIGDRRLGGGLFGRTDDGDVSLELVHDEDAAGVVDPGDVIRVRESEGLNLSGADIGRTLWINVMILPPDQRSSEALTQTWKTVWATAWRVGD
jgi:hypothetical protein